eukprot:g2317.t1
MRGGKSWLIFVLVVTVLLLAGYIWQQRASAKSDEDTIREYTTNSNSVNSQPKSGTLTAILVAGSEGYRNYRHQADICHAFQVLKDNGVSEDSIITFVYDDIVHYWRNPLRGNLYNRPGGRNVYPGCAKDYTGHDVNKEVFLAVLRGDSRAVKGIGSGRVLAKNPNQRVFFAYSDHGGVGTLLFPHGDDLHADELNKAIVDMKENSMFREMLIYTESCYAGSMYAGMEISKQDNILAVTAANAHESSYATYCPTDSFFSRFLPPYPNPDFIGSCMGDLFTVAWIEDTETRDLSTTKISAQVKEVTERTSDSGTYYIGSHVTSYGDTKLKLAEEVLAMFMGDYKGASKRSRSLFPWTNTGNTNWPRYKQADADLLSLSMMPVRRGDNPATSALKEEQRKRKEVDEAIKSALLQLIQRGELSSETSVSKLANELLPRGRDEPVVNDWDCLRGMVAAWKNKHGKLNSYSAQYTRTFANLCNAMVSPAAFKESLSGAESVYVSEARV